MESFVKSKFNIVFLSTFVSVNFAFAGENENNSFVSIQDISNTYLKSFGYQEGDNNIVPIQAARDRQKKIDYSTVKPPKMDDITFRKTIFDIYNNSPRTTDFIKNNSKVFNKFAWNDLKLFCGTPSDLQHNLLSRLNHTKTTIGECALSILLATPTDDISELMYRQEIINSFLTIDSVNSNVKYYIELFRNVEQNFISFWSKTDPIYNQAYNDFLVKKFFFKNKKLNNRIFPLEGWKRIKWDILGIACPFVLPPLIEGLNDDNIGGYSTTRFFPNFLCHFPIVNVFTYLSTISNTKNFNFNYTMMILFSNCVNIWKWYDVVDTFKENKNLLKNLALRLNDVKTFLYVITKINNIISSNETLNNAFSNKLVAIRSLIELSNSGKTPLGRFLKNLKSLPLYDMHFFLNNTGKLLSCFNFFVYNKHLFNDAIYELGQIDVFVSIADLIKKSTEYNDIHTFNFTKFLNKQMSNFTPHLSIKEMWNPFLDSRIAIGNSVEFGENSSSGLKNMILTGPNAGGKSTFIVGLEISVLLSQVFGIAPADECILTPFSRVNSYIEVNDDIAAGKSLFMAEVDRVQNHINILDSLKPDEYSFTIFDEPFRGTNPYEGAAVEYSVLETLAKYKNTFNIVATHYPMITLLEEKKHEFGFRNYKVFISRDTEKNDIIYHFKIVPGRATQSIAIDILEKYGYAPDLLLRAKDIVNNPQKYEAGF